MSTTQENAQNDRQELLELREVCGQQAEQIKALEAKLEALDGLMNVAAYSCRDKIREYVERERLAIMRGVSTQDTKQ